MAAGNVVTLVGNATRDPELQYTASGQANTKFGLAVSRRWQNKQTQEWEEETSFFNVVCWAQMAENVAESLMKGSRVFVTGRVDVRNYETKEGEKRISVDVVADEIGPSLRWATCEVTRNERSDSTGANGRGKESVRSGANSGSSSFDEEPW